MPVKTVTIQVNALTDKANADIRATGKYFDDLRAKNPVELKVKFDKAQALAESKILAKEMSQTVRDTVKLEVDKSGGGGLTGIGRLLGGASGGGGLLSLVLGAPGAGGAAGGGAGIGIGIAAGLAALESGLAGIIPAIAAAGLATAAFGALAIPTFMNVAAAISGVSAANAKFAEAAGLVDTAIQTSAADMKVYKDNLAALPPNLRSAEKLLGDTSVTWQGLTKSQQNNVIALSQNHDALKVMLPAQKTALTQLLASKAVWDQLTPAQQKVAIGWQNLSAAYGKLVTALAPDVLKVLNSGMKVATALLPTLLPLAQTAAHVFEGLATGMAKFFQTTQTSTPEGWKPGEKLITTLTPFGQFMKQMTALAGPALAAIGEGLGKIAIAVGKLLIAMTNPNAIKILKVLLDGVALAIDLVAAAFNYATPRIINNFHDIASAADHTRIFFISWAHDIEKNFDDFRHRTAVVFDGIRGDIAHYWDMTWNNTVARVSRGISDAAKDFDDFRHRTAVIFDGIRGDIAHYWDMTWNNTIGRIQRGIADAVTWFRGMPGRVENAVSALAGRLTTFGSTVLTDFLNGVKSIWTTVEGWFSGLPGKILSALGIKSPPDWAISAGKHVMGGLLKGIAHGATDVKGFFVGLASDLLGPLKSIWSKIFGGGGKFGGSVATWAGDVEKALAMEGLPLSLTHNVLYQMQTESGGNPNAINLTDINAQMGDPSRGLMQVIGATFAAYHWPGTSSNIYDPLANIAAAINYARHVYGPTLMSGGSGLGSGHGYAMGTGSALPGWAWVGERGPELVNFRGGEQVRPAGSGGGTAVYITVNVPPTVNPADAGRQVARLLLEHTKRGGRLYPAGTVPR